MSILINCAAIPGGDGDTEISFDYGECEVDDLFDLAQLVELTGTEECTHRVLVWHMNSDQQLRYKATGIACVQYQIDREVDRLYYMDEVIDGPFLFMLAVGDKFKAFHCSGCAEDFVSWFVSAQRRWRNDHHGSLSQSAPTPKKSYQ